MTNEQKEKLRRLRAERFKTELQSLLAKHNVSLVIPNDSETIVAEFDWGEIGQFDLPLGSFIDSDEKQYN